jgi:AsmA protein
MIRSLFKFVFITLIVVGLLLGGAIAAIPYVYPPEKFKPIIKDFVKIATGRELDIKGEISFSVFPDIALKATDISFSNAEGATTPQMAELSSVSVGLKVLPLLSKRVELDDFILINPVINLEVDKSGKPNWEMTASEEKKPEDAAAEPSSFNAAAVVFSKLKIVNGTVNYVNIESGDKHSVTSLNLEVAARTLEDALKASGAMALDGHNIDFSTTLDSPAKLMAKESFNLNAKITLASLEAEYDGSVHLADVPAAEGKLTLDMSSLHKTLALTGSTPAPGSKDSSLKLRTPVVMKNKKITMDNLDVTFDQIKASGSVIAALDSTVPDIKAALSLAELDVRPYMSAEAKSAAPATDAAAAPAEPNKELFSNDTLALGGLSAVDANIEATIGKIILPQTQVNNTAISVVSKGGKLTATLKETSLYDGKGKAQLVLDGRGTMPAVEHSLALEGVNIGQFLQDFGYTDRIEGKGDFNIAVAGIGRSQAEIVNNLDGQGNVRLSGGKYKGINLMNIVNTINTLGSASATLGNLFNAEAVTDVSDMTATFTLKSGVLYNNDLLLKSPVGTVTGEGEMNLAKNLIKYRLTPKADVGLESTSIGFKVPVVIQGNLNNPQIAPDTKRLLTDGLQIKALDENLSPAEKIEAVKDDLINLRKGVKGDVGGVLNNLMGGIPGLGGAKKADPAATAPEAPAATESTAPATQERRAPEGNPAAE